MKRKRPNLRATVYTRGLSYYDRAIARRVAISSASRRKPTRGSKRAVIRETTSVTFNAEDLMTLARYVSAGKAVVHYGGTPYVMIRYPVFRKLKFASTRLGVLLTQEL